MVDFHLSGLANSVKKLLQQLVYSGKQSSRDPLFYFGLTSLVLVGALFFSSDSFATLGNDTTNVVFLNASLARSYINSANSFVGQQLGSVPETPSLGTSQDGFIVAVAPPHAVSLQTLGDISSGNTPSTSRKEVTNYVTQAGDTVQSVADKFGISANTVAWANNLSVTSPLSSGDKLTILPVSGVLHVVQSGDTIANLAKTFKANSDEIIAFNGLQNEEDVYVGDILIIPGGVMPAKPQPSSVIAAPDNYFIFPLLHFIITQGLHYYNAIDIQSLGGFGSPVYAAASGVI